MWVRGWLHLLFAQLLIALTLKSGAAGATDPPTVKPPACTLPTPPPVAPPPAYPPRLGGGPAPSMATVVGEITNGVPKGTTIMWQGGVIKDRFGLENTRGLGAEIQSAGFQALDRKYNAWKPDLGTNPDGTPVAWTKEWNFHSAARASKDGPVVWVSPDVGRAYELGHTNKVNGQPLPGHNTGIVGLELTTMRGPFARDPKTGNIFFGNGCPPDQIPKGWTLLTDDPRPPLPNDFRGTVPLRSDPKNPGRIADAPKLPASVEATDALKSANPHKSLADAGWTIRRGQQDGSWVAYKADGPDHTRVIRFDEGNPKLDPSKPGGRVDHFHNDLVPNESLEDHLTKKGNGKGAQPYDAEGKPIKPKGNSVEAKNAGKEAAHIPATTEQSKNSRGIVGTPGFQDAEAHRADQKTADAKAKDAAAALDRLKNEQSKLKTAAERDAMQPRIDEAAREARDTAKKATDVRSQKPTPAPATPPSSSNTPKKTPRPPGPPIDTPEMVRPRLGPGLGAGMRRAPTASAAPALGRVGAVGNNAVVWAEAVMVIGRMIEQYDKDRVADLAELNSKAFDEEFAAWLDKPASELRYPAGRDRDAEIRELGRHVLPYFVQPSELKELLGKGDSAELDAVLYRAGRNYLELRFVQETGWKPRWSHTERTKNRHWYTLPQQMHIAFNDPVYTGPDGKQKVLVRFGGNLANPERTTRTMTMDDYRAWATKDDYSVTEEHKYDTPAPRNPVQGRVRDIPKLRLPYTANGVDDYLAAFEKAGTRTGRTEAIYRSIAGRPPTEQEQEAATDDKVARRQAVDTADARQQMADIWRRYLAREPNPGELDGWANRIADGMSFSEYEVSVERSTEGRKVNHFREVFGRDPAAGELDRWGQGKEGDAYRDAIARSPEARAELVRKLKAEMPGGEPSPELVDRFVKLVAAGKQSAEDARFRVIESLSFYEAILGRPANPGDAQAVFDRAARIAENPNRYVDPHYALRLEVAKSPEGRAALEKMLGSINLELKAGPEGDKFRARLEKELAQGNSLSQIRFLFAGGKTVGDSMDRAFTTRFGRAMTEAEKETAVEAVRAGKTPREVIRAWPATKK